MPYSRKNKTVTNIKLPLSNKDVLQATDFTYRRYAPARHSGLSGNLLLATCKQNGDIQYVVKHTKPECACNEFMFYKFAEYFKLSVPEVKLFQISSENSNLFKSGNAVGIKYIPNAKGVCMVPKSEIINWTDFYSLHALQCILNDDDIGEFVIDQENRLFKIDHAESFNMDTLLIKSAMAFENLRQQEQEVVYELLMRAAKYMPDTTYRSCLEFLKKNYGDEAITYYLKIFENFAELNNNAFEDAINVVCYFYNNIMRDFYREFIQHRKEACKKFLSGI